MRNPLLLIFTMLLSSGVTSQRIIEIGLPTPKPLQSADFICVEVIDKRPDTLLGTIHTGMVNNSAHAVLKRDYSSTLFNAITDILPPGPDKTPLIVIVHRIRISEHITISTESAYCEVEIELASRQGSRLVSLGIYDSSARSGGIDVTGGHGKRIVQCLSECLETFMLSTSVVSMDSLPEVSDVRPVLNYLTLPSPGAYVSFGQMARNSPLPNLKVRLTLENPSGKIEKYTARTQGEKQSHIRYIVDSQAVYINVGKIEGEHAYIKSKHYGRYIYFELRNYDADMAWAFGLVGALASNRRRAMILDADTGLISEFDEYTLAKLAKDSHRDIISTYRKSPRKIEDLEAAVVSLNAKYQ